MGFECAFDPGFRRQLSVAADQHELVALNVIDGFIAFPRDPAGGEIVVDVTPDPGGSCVASVRVSFSR